ncbi:flagellar hook-length control protein FliK [Desertibacillus haloalkaliphilus]|uniref:flagellar hook-length control protein FliK n=1 Tax=Desertibacillus haloalkaliphilus TaxID=1328930 RepID=UPI001C272C69|nr:flagellar hook-length control protein FliK [Desertibacillus haloalkaliphilus]MBU8907009.1 flagellar hook-length control protein FliK [Desertibacillus haloalkaliphilus]
MNMVMVQASTNPSGNITKNESRPSSTSQGFTGLLSQAMTSKTPNQTEVEQKPRQADVELVEGELDEKLSQLLSVLVTGVATRDGFLNEEMVEQPDIKSMLDSLPEELSADVVSFFHQEMPIETLLDSDELSSLIAIIASFSHLEQTGKIDKQNGSYQHMIDLFSKKIDTFIPSSINMSQEIKSMSDMIKHLTSLLEQSNPIQSAMKSSGLLFNPSSNSMNAPIQLGTEGTSQHLQLTLSDLGQQMNRTQQFTIHVGEAQPKEAQQQQFVRQFQEMIGKSFFTNFKNGDQQLSVKLYPEHLGRLDIRLTQTNGTIVAQIMTSSTAARELVESQLQHLRNAFAQQQISVERVEVTQQQHQTLGQSQKDEQDKHDHREHEKEENQEEEGVASSFSEFLDELTFNEKV